MIDETIQDDAGLYVMRMLPPDEAAAFEKRLAMDGELQQFVQQLEDAAGYMVHAAPSVAPPPALKGRILSDIRHEVRVIPMTTGRKLAWVPWALAAGLAIAATMFWQQASIYRQQSTAYRQESLAYREQTRAQETTIAELRTRDALSSVQIASLSSKLTVYENALATVVFDAQQQRGLVKLDRFPKAAANKDYQLWVIPTAGNPVSAGLVPVGDDGLARVSFKPTQPVPNIGAFAISVEPAGGSTQPRGEVVLVGK
jgi:anti-sigma-K factor RskA